MKRTVIALMIISSFLKADFVEKLLEAKYPKLSNDLKKAKALDIENKNGAIYYLISKTVPKKTIESFVDDYISRGINVETNYKEIIFVFQGIVENDYAQSLANILSEKKLRTRIIIDPKVFKKHIITRVPTLILAESNADETPSKNSTLSYKASGVFSLCKLLTNIDIYNKGVEYENICFDTTF